MLRSRPLRLLAALLVWGASLVALPPEAGAQRDPTVLIVVDLQFVLDEAAATRTVDDQIDALRQAYVVRFAELEAELRAIEAELGELRTTLPSEEFIRRQREFERRIADAQREAQAGRGELDQAREAAMGTINETLYQLIIEIAQEQGADLVIDQRVAIVTSRALDFTEMALERLDAALPHVDVVLPQRPAD